MSVMLSVGRKCMTRKSKSARPKTSKARPAAPAATASSSSSATVSADNVKSWGWEMDGIDVKIMFRKDTRDVWVNGDKTDTMSDFVDNGAIMDFVVYSQKARITGKRVSVGGEMQYTLNVNGYEIPASR